MVTFITQRLNFVTSVFTSKEITLYQNVQVQLANNQFKISILLWCLVQPLSKRLLIQMKIIFKMLNILQTSENEFFTHQKFCFKS